MRQLGLAAAEYLCAAFHGCAGPPANLVLNKAGFGPSTSQARHFWPRARNRYAAPAFHLLRAPAELPAGGFAKRAQNAAEQRFAIACLALYFAMDGGIQRRAFPTRLSALRAARELGGFCRIIASAPAHLSIGKSAQIASLDYKEIAIYPGRRLTTSRCITAYRMPARCGRRVTNEPLPSWLLESRERHLRIDFGRTQTRAGVEALAIQFDDHYAA